MICDHFGPFGFNERIRTQLIEWLSYEVFDPTFSRWGDRHQASTLHLAWRGPGCGTDGVIEFFGRDSFRGDFHGLNFFFLPSIVFADQNQRQI